MKRLSFGALAISLAISAPAMAQTAPGAAPAAQPQPGAPASAPAVDARSAATDASVTVGMPVKDNAGVDIGTVSSVQPGPNGTPTATIKMGTKVFSVGTDTLAVNGGAATVNASKTQIEGMLPKS